jgi:hypothetical protein
VALLFSLLALAACGEQKTPGPSITSSAFTAPTTTKSANPTATPALTSSVTKSTAFLEVAGASEVPLDNTFSSEVSKLLGTTKNLSVRLYSSEDSAEKLANSFDSAITTKGYTALSGKPSKSGDTYVGIYTKTGAEDLILTSLDTPKDAGELANNLNLPGLSSSSLNNLYRQIKGKKAIAFVFSGTDLVKAVFEAANTSPTPVVTPQVEVTAPPSATPVPAVTPVVNGPGSELVNTLLATAEVDLRVKKVERYDELNYEGQTIKPKGVFLVISYEFANVSKSPVAFVSLTLKDGQNREFETAYDGEVNNALYQMGYRSSYIVNPGFSGGEYKVYDVPKEANGFKLEPFIETERKPSLASFSSNGGKGPDSGAGAELIGQTITIDDEKTEVKVLNVERVSTLKDGGKSYNSPGVFLIVTYEMKNNGVKATSGPVFRLEDSEGRAFSTTDNFEVLIAAGKNTKTKLDVSVNPGQSGVNYKVFEVVKEASGFKLAALS